MSFDIVRVKITYREDGGMRAFSNDQKGLILSGESPQRIWELIGPCLEKLAEMNGKRIVKVYYPSLMPPEIHELGETIEVNFPHETLKHLESNLEEGLEETFPASDPVSAHNFT